MSADSFFFPISENISVRQRFLFAQMYPSGAKRFTNQLYLRRPECVKQAPHPNNPQDLYGTVVCLLQISRTLQIRCPPTASSLLLLPPKSFPDRLKRLTGGKRIEGDLLAALTRTCPGKKSFCTKVNINPGDRCSAKYFGRWKSLKMFL